jgi:toxin ParE1/3/4
VKRAGLLLSDAAVADILEQADWYLTQSGAVLAGRWEKAVTLAALRIVKNPLSGTPCNFKSSEITDVRRASIAGFPKHLLFYKFDKRSVFILRVVHGARDLERLL